MEKKDPRKEVGLRRLTVMLVVFTALVVVYDVWCLASGNAKEGLYIMPFALGAFIAIMAKIISHLERFDPDDRDRFEATIPKDSYLHPDNHPKGRRDAPDGTSD
ncbi:MAG TPA: hypothetical protein VL500_04605 [Candidatus Eisenbacteria bacterium]|nr:hypothetical protein [Candidatus Eisenbacteria bacterium]